MQYDSTNLEDVVYADGIPTHNDASEQFLEASKIARITLTDDLPGIGRIQGSKALRNMTHRAARRYSHRPTISLPEPAISRTADFHTVVMRRRSADWFGAEPIGIHALSNIMHHSYRVVRRNGLDVGFRSTPSAGALYPLDIFLLTLNCADPLPNEHCLYYDPFSHQLIDLGITDKSNILTAFGDDLNVSKAGLIFVITAMFSRSRIKYGQRGTRFCFIEAGHLAQSATLAAQASNLHSRIWGGFFDDALTALIPGLDGVDSAPIHAIVLGSGS